MNPKLLPRNSEQKDKAEKALERYQLLREKRLLYNAVRRKATRRAYSLLRKYHSSEYQAFLNRETNELMEQYKRNQEKKRKKVTNDNYGLHGR